MEDNFKILQLNQSNILKLYKLYDISYISANEFENELVKLGLFITENFKIALRLVENSNISAGINIAKDPNSVDTINQNKYISSQPIKHDLVKPKYPINDAPIEKIDLKRNNIYLCLKSFCEEKINGHQLKISLKDIGIQPASSSLPKVGYFSPEQEHIIDQQESSGRRVLKDLVKIFLASSTELPVQERTKMILPSSQNVFTSGSSDLTRPAHTVNYDLKLKSADTFKWHVDADTEPVRHAHKYVPTIDTNNLTKWSEEPYEQSYSTGKKILSSVNVSNFSENFVPNENSVQPYVSARKSFSPSNKISISSHEPNLNEFGRSTSRRELIDSKLRLTKNGSSAGIYNEESSPAYSNSNSWKTVAQESFQHGKNIKTQEVISKPVPKVDTQNSAPFGTDLNAKPYVKKEPTGELNPARLRDHYSHIHRSL